MAIIKVYIDFVTFADDNGRQKNDLLGFSEIHFSGMYNFTEIDNNRLISGSRGVC